MGLPSFGTLLKIGDGGSPESFTTIAEVLDIGGPDLNLDTEETTNHSSTGGWEEFVPTILRSGAVDFEVNFDPNDSTHSYSTGLIADMISRTKRKFQLVFPTTPTVIWAFTAIVTKFAPAEPVAGKLSASVSLKITGQPELA